MNVKRIAAVLALGGALLAGGVDAADAPAPKPEAGKAMLVFLHPSRFHYRTSLYRINGEGQEFIGILDKHRKIAYPSPPGDQLFMIVGGENADFLEAHLVAGKTYYAYAAARTGVWRSRFSLIAVHNDSSKTSVTSREFAGWLGDCEWVTPTDADHAWYESNKASVDKKRAAYLRRWNARDEELKDRQTLIEGDGV